MGDGHAVNEQQASGKLGSPAFCAGKAAVPATNEPLWRRSGRALSWRLSSAFQGTWVAKKVEV